MKKLVLIWFFAFFSQITLAQKTAKTSLEVIEILIDEIENIKKEGNHVYNTVSNRRIIIYESSESPFYDDLMNHGKVEILSDTTGVDSDVFKISPVQLNAKLGFVARITFFQLAKINELGLYGWVEYPISYDKDKKVFIVYTNKPSYGGI